MKKVLLSLGLVLLFVPLLAGAQTGPVRGAWDIGDITAIIDRVSTWLYIIGIALAIVMVIIGGIRYMTAGGSEDGQKTAKKTIISGLIGAGVLVLAGVILDTIVSFIQ